MANSIIFGTCTTAANVANKIVIIDKPTDITTDVVINGYPFEGLVDGLMFAVYFEHGNSALAPYITFQLNDGTQTTLVGDIYCNALTPATDNELFSWQAGSLVIFTLITSASLGNKCIMANWQDLSSLSTLSFSLDSSIPSAELDYNPTDATDSTFSLGSFVTHDEAAEFEDISLIPQMFGGYTTYYTLTNVLEPGKKYIVANGNTGTIYMLSNVSGGSRILNSVSTTVNNNAIAIDDSIKSSVAFNCILYDANNSITTTLESNGSYLYTDNTNGLRFEPAASLNRFWHYIGSKFWQFKNTADNGYTDTSTEYKYYLELNASNGFTDNHVVTTSIQDSSIPPMYLFVEDDGTGVIATGVSLNKNTHSMAIGATTRLTATVLPANTTNQAVSWSSSNSSVALVNSTGLVTGVSEGTATITVTTISGNQTAQCVVTITNSGGGGGGSTPSSSAEVRTLKNSDGTLIIYPQTLAEGVYSSSLGTHLEDLLENKIMYLDENQTVSGTKTFNSTVTINPNTHDKIHLPRQGITKGTAPSETVYNTIFFLDSSNDAGWPAGRMGQLEQSLDANGDNRMSLATLVPVANSTTCATLTLKASPDGSTQADFNTCLYAPELIVTNPNGVRFTYGGSGNTSSFLFRNDGTDFYGLVCNSDSPGDNWITPSGGGHPLRINLATGYVYTTRLYGAVWNDYAEYREGECIEPGYVMVETGYDTVRKSNERMEAFAGISSDTFGFAIGETDKAKIPIAVSGRVLVYTLRPRDEYKPGDCVCAAEGGKVDIMTREEIQQYPDRIVGTVSAVPEYETWGQNNIPVNGRIWIKVK